MTDLFKFLYTLSWYYSARPSGRGDRNKVVSEDQIGPEYTVI